MGSDLANRTIAHGHNVLESGTRTSPTRLTAHCPTIRVCPKEMVTPDAYVRIQPERHRNKKLYRVSLLTDSEVTRLVVYREAILAEEKEARHTHWPRLCQRCSFRQECKSPYRRGKRGRGIEGFCGYVLKFQFYIAAQKRIKLVHICNFDGLLNCRSVVVREVFL